MVLYELTDDHHAVDKECDGCIGGGHYFGLCLCGEEERKLIKLRVYAGISTISKNPLAQSPTTSLSTLHLLLNIVTCSASTSSERK